MQTYPSVHPCMQDAAQRDSFVRFGISLKGRFKLARRSNKHSWSAFSVATLLWIAARLRVTLIIARLSAVALIVTRLSVIPLVVALLSTVPLVVAVLGAIALVEALLLRSALITACEESGLRIHAVDANLIAIGQHRLVAMPQRDPVVTERPPQRRGLPTDVRVAVPSASISTTHCLRDTLSF